MADGLGNCHAARVPTTSDEDVRRVPVGVLVNSWVAIVVVAAGGAIAWSAVSQPVTTRQFGTLAALGVLAIGYDWLARRVELLRRRMNSGPYVTMDSVWILAAVCTLPVSLTSCLVVVIWAHEYYQSRRAHNARPFIRNVFNVAAAIVPAAVVTEVVARSGVLVRSGGPLGDGVVLGVLVGAVLLYAVGNGAIVGVVIALSTGERRLRSLAGTATENLVEIASLSLGVLVGVAITLAPWLALLAVPVLVVLQRMALVDHLESAASEDAKTGLLNAAAWTHIAERDLERASARDLPAAVMVLDLDHFKRVNDTYGHLTGDLVLRSVAECMRGMLRDRDQVARFGGEEFVAFLPGADASEALKVAERLRQRVADAVVVPLIPRRRRGTGRGPGAAARSGSWCGSR